MGKEPAESQSLGKKYVNQSISFPIKPTHFLLTHSLACECLKELRNRVLAEHHPLECRIRDGFKREKKAWNKLKWIVTILSWYTILPHLHFYQDGVFRLFLTVHALTPRPICKASHVTTACPTYWLLSYHLQIKTKGPPPDKWHLVLYYSLCSSAC